MNNEPGGETARERQGCEESEPPGLRLDAGRADAIVPGLAGALIGCLGLRGLAVAGRGAFEHSGSVLLAEIDRGADAAAVAGAHGMGDGRHAPVPRDMTCVV